MGFPAAAAIYIYKYSSEITHQPYKAIKERKQHFNRDPNSHKIPKMEMICFHYIKRPLELQITK